MSLQNIEYECDKENIICKRYSNKHNDIVQNWRDVSDLLSAFRSEGERIIASVEKWASRELVKDLLTNEDDMYILFDELDSGLSLDRMYYFFSQLTYGFIFIRDKNTLYNEGDECMLITIILFIISGVLFIKAIKDEKESQSCINNIIQANKNFDVMNKRVNHK